MIHIKIENAFKAIKKNKNTVAACLAWITGQAKKQLEKNLAEELKQSLSEKNIKIKVWITKGDED